MKRNDFFESVLIPAFGIAFDGALLLAAFMCAYWLRFKVPFMMEAFPLGPGKVPILPGHYLSGMAGVVGIWLLVFYYAGLYEDPFLPFEDAAVAILKACFQGMLLTFAVSFLYQRFSDSRLVAALVFPISTAFALAGRAAFKALVRRAFGTLIDPPRVLLVGGGGPVELVKERLERSGLRRLTFKPRLAKEEILREARAARADEVILTESPLGKSELIDLAESLEEAGARLRIVPSLLEMRLGEVQMDRSLGLPMLGISHASLAGPDRRTKRIFDMVFSVLFLAVFAVPLLLLCLIIKIESRGPILFRQRRVGYKGRPFDLYKFRTMVQGADARRGEVAHRNERPGPVFKMKDDPRVTRVGRWLRRLSVDEIPQFINVLKGEMSVAGPRPPLPREVADYPAAAMRRLNVLPGITGLWQVSGRAALDFDQMVALDLYYIEHWSLGLDLKIILKTPGAILSTRGAY